MSEYATRDIANIVGIAAPTVRKYAQALEEAGYKFMKDGRDNRGTRIFCDEDIYYFQEMNKRSSDTGMAVKQIAIMLVSQGKRDTEKNENTVSVSDSLQQNEVKISDSLYTAEQFKQFFVQQFESVKEELNRNFEEQLNKKLDEQREYFEEKLKWIERDREKNESLRRSLIETQKQHQQQIAAALEEKKKGFFSRLFGK